MLSPPPNLPAIPLWTLPASIALACFSFFWYVGLPLSAFKPREEEEEEEEEFGTERRLFPFPLHWLL